MTANEFDLCCGNKTDEGYVFILSEDERKAVMAALAKPPAQDGWQNIESAPRDGTKILVHKPQLIPPTGNHSLRRQPKPLRRNSGRPFTKSGGGAIN